MTQEEKEKLIAVDPKIHEATYKFLEMIQEGRQYEDINQAGQIPTNIFWLDLEPKTVNYDKDNEDNLLVREDDGALLLRGEMSEIQKRSNRMILGQFAKSIFTMGYFVDLRIPIFSFQPRTYLQL